MRTLQGSVLQANAYGCINGVRCCAAFVLSEQNLVDDAFQPLLLAAAGQFRRAADYSADACPKTLEILSRSLRLSINQAMTGQNMLEIAEAINKADASF